MNQHTSLGMNLFPLLKEELQNYLDFVSVLYRALPTLRSKFKHRKVSI